MKDSALDIRELELRLFRRSRIIVGDSCGTVVRVVARRKQEERRMLQEAGRGESACRPSVGRAAAEVELLGRGARWCRIVRVRRERSWFSTGALKCALALRDAAQARKHFLR